MKTVIAIAGPTASGKTALAIASAAHFDTAVINADSRQCYREMSIGTAAPSLEEQQGIPHYFVQSHSIHQPLTAGMFAEEALPIVMEWLHKRDTVVVAGGSGLYLKALLYGFDQIPKGDPAIRQQLNERYQVEGLPYLQTLLAQQDPDYYKQVDRQNPHRLLRALEVCLTTGLPYSSFRTGNAAMRPFRSVVVGIDWPRAELYQRIDSRVDTMMDEGLLEEVRRLLPYRSLPALDTVGYKELFAYLDGRYTLQEAVALIKQHTRQFAKRQLTWCRQQLEMQWWPAGSTSAMLSSLESAIR